MGILLDNQVKKNHTFSLKGKPIISKSKLGSEKTFGENEWPEDWIRSLKMTLNNIAWRKGTRLFLFIANNHSH